MRLTDDWTLAHAGGEAHLSAVVPISGDLIYLFSAMEGRPSESLPRTAAELLLFEPIVPLRYTMDGFQALLPSEWEDMAASKDTYIGLNTFSAQSVELDDAETGDAAAWSASESEIDDLSSEDEPSGSDFEDSDVSD